MRRSHAEQDVSYPHLAYLIAAYPAVSHTFIAREIAALRERGLKISTMSIRKTPPEQLLADADRAEASETFSVLPVDRRRLARVHLKALRRRPGAYLSTMRWAVSLSEGGARANLWQLFYFAEAILVWDECRSRGINHVHAHFANVASAVAMFAARFGRSDGLTWSFTMHGPTEFDDVTRFALAAKIRDAGFVACISDYCRSQLLRLVEPEFWAKLTVVRCGLRFTDQLDSDVDDHTAVGGPVRLLCVGRLVPDKGQRVLLEALAKLREEGQRIETTLVGDGPDREALEQASKRLGLEQSTVFAGALSHDRVQELYLRSDIFCLPSFAEGLPVVLMEAMSHGLPVVTTRIAGISELVQNAVSGAIVAPGRSDALAGAISELADDAVLRTRFGIAGRKKVQAEYDVGQSADRLLRLIREVG